MKEAKQKKKDAINLKEEEKQKKKEEKHEERSGKELKRKAEKEECANCFHLISKRYVVEHMTKCSSANPKFCLIC